MPQFRAVIVSAILVLSVAAAQAGTAVRVNLRDLNPSDPHDSQVLAERVHAAAEDACGPARVTSDTRFSALSEAESDRRACVRQAEARAMALVEAARPAMAMTGTPAQFASK
jgi:UrcA family protein